MDLLPWRTRRSCVGFNTMRPNSSLTLEPLRSASWTVLARRRNLRQNQRTLDLSLPCRRQRGKNRRLPVAPAKRDVAAAKAFFRLAFRRQGGLPLKITLDGYRASHRAAKEALDEHPEGNRCKDQIVKIFEQFDRTGSSIRQASARSRCSTSRHFRQARNDDRRHRTHASDPQGSVQTR